MNLALYDYQHQFYDEDHQLVQHAMSLPHSDLTLTGLEMTSKNDKSASDAKPRLTKEQHEILESHFQIEHKPCTNIKKGFAERLGVPLDKINNWFQNRRAKDKQDRKKAQGVYDLLRRVDPKMAQYQQTPCSPSFCDPDFLQLMIQTMADRRNQQPIDEGRMNQWLQTNTYDASISTMQPSMAMNTTMHGYVIGEVSDAVPARSQYAEFQNHQPHMASAYGYRPNPSTPVSQGSGSSVSPIASSSGNQPMAASNYVLPFRTQTVGPLDSGQPPSYAADEAHALLNTPMPRTNGAHWLAEGNAGIIWGRLDGQPDFTSTNTYTTQQPLSTDMQEQQLNSLPLTGPQPSFTSFHDPAIDSNQLETGIQQCPRDDQFGHGQSGPTEYIQHVPGIPQAPQPPVARLDSCTQDNSKAFALADSSGATEIPPLPRHGPAFRLPRTHSSIAARRHQRPQALSRAAFRSASYADILPLSPSTIGNDPASDQTLRRIRSTGISGVGRIQKPNQGSAQRSPLNMSFPDATTPPIGYRRHTSHGSTNTTASIPSSAASLAPPTPLSPYETAGDRPYTNGGGSGGFEGLDRPGFSWNHAFGNMASPPATPLTVDQGMQISLPNASLTYTEGIHSAPAWQQSFPLSPAEAYGGLQHVVGVPQIQEGNNTSQTYGAPLNGPVMSTRQISMPSGMPLRGPSFHDAAAQSYSSFEPNANNPHVGDVGHQYHGFQFQQAQLGGGRLHHQRYPMALQLASPSTNQMQTLPTSASNLFVHEWSPPQGSTPPPRLTQGQPRNYTFSNIGPEAYSSP